MSLLFTRQKIDIPPEIVYLSRENVVMHVSSRPHPNRSLLRTAFGQDMSDTIDAASSITQTGNLPLKTFTIADHDSPFSHMRISTPNDGKFLVFPKRRNIIRAGKYTHADAFMSTVRFLSWSGLGKNRWPSGFNAPNAVFCGRFAGRISNAIKKYPFAAFSSRFPGVSINVAAAAVALDINPTGAETATPEIYMSGKFIIPGIKSAAALNISLAVLADVWKFVSQ